MFFLSPLVEINYRYFSHGSPGIGRVMNPKRKATEHVYLFFKCFCCHIPKFLGLTHNLLRGSKPISKTCPPSLIYSWVCAVKREMGLKSIWVKIYVHDNLPVVSCKCSQAAADNYKNSNIFLASISYVWHPKLLFILKQTHLLQFFWKIILFCIYFYQLIFIDFYIYPR